METDEEELSKVVAFLSCPDENPAPARGELEGRRRNLDLVNDGDECQRRNPDLQTAVLEHCLTFMQNNSRKYIFLWLQDLKN